MFYPRRSKGRYHKTFWTKKYSKHEKKRKHLPYLLKTTIFTSIHINKSQNYMLFIVTERISNDMCCHRRHFGKKSLSRDVIVFAYIFYFNVSFTSFFDWSYLFHSKYYTMPNLNYIKWLLRKILKVFNFTIFINSGVGFPNGAVINLEGNPRIPCTIFRNKSHMIQILSLYMSVLIFVQENI